MCCGAGTSCSTRTTASAVLRHHSSLLKRGRVGVGWGKEGEEEINEMMDGRVAVEVMLSHGDM